MFLFTMGFILLGLKVEAFGVVQKFRTLMRLRISSKRPF